VTGRDEADSRELILEEPLIILGLCLMAEWGSVIPAAAVVAVFGLLDCFSNRAVRLFPTK
jgi:hypothetical protein